MKTPRRRICAVGLVRRRCAVSIERARLSATDRQKRAWSRAPDHAKAAPCSSPQERAGNSEITQALLKSMAYCDPVLLYRLAPLADGRAMLAKRYPKS
jgi:hypothetical protein